MEKLICPHCNESGVLPGIISAKEALMLRLSKKYETSVFFQVTSGYRCLVHDKAINPKGKNRTHAIGCALDGKCYYYVENRKHYIDRKEVMNEAKQMKIFGGIGIYDDGHIHIDTYERYGAEYVLLWEVNGNDIKYIKERI
jgi:uncharacterized protein YcbK (DUF882 family)